MSKSRFGSWALGLTLAPMCYSSAITGDGFVDVTCRTGVTQAHRSRTFRTPCSDIMTGKHSPEIGGVLAEEEDDYVESDPHHDPEPADEPVSSSGYSQSDLHAEDDEEEPLPEIEIPPELQQVAKKGWTAELLILVVGGAALLAAVGVVLFLVL